MLQAIAKRHTKCGKRTDRETVTVVIAAFPATATSAIVLVVDTAVAADPRPGSRGDVPHLQIPAHPGPGRRALHQATPIITIIITAVMAAAVVNAIIGPNVGTAARNGLSAQCAILEIQWTSGRHTDDQTIPLVATTHTTVTRTTKKLDRVDPVHVRHSFRPLIRPILTNFFRSPVVIKLSKRTIHCSLSRLSCSV